MQLLFSLKSIFKSCARWVAFIFAPPYCEGCDIALPDRFIFCSDCYLKIKPVATLQLQVTPKHAAKIYAMADYAFPLKRLILAKRISNRLAAEYLGQLSWQLSGIKFAEFDCIVPVPLHWSRRVKRGYNQTDVMAEKIAELSGKPVCNVLRRVKRTVFQTELDAAAREENIKGCFKLEGKAVAGKRVLLVDDLLTSGATLKHATKELLKAGPESIAVVVACRVV